jgi:CheY-like chemotaxis protein
MLPATHTYPGRKGIYMAERLNVLLVDDSADDTTILHRAFSRIAPDIVLHFARSGVEALDYLKGADHFADRNRYPLPSLLVLDLKMPGVDGFDVIQWVRKESQLNDLPIVVLSSSNDPSDISRAHELGADAYHVKPSDLNALIGLVEGLKTYWIDKKLDPGCLPV